MLDKSGPASPSPALRQIASTFRRTGWASIIFQGVLAVVSTVVLLFAGLFSPRTGVGPNGVNTNSFSTGAGVGLTTLSIFVLSFSIYWAFRYVVIGRQLQSDTAVRPKKSETIKTLRTGLMAGLAGMLLAIFGAEAIVGVLVGKASVSQGSNLTVINPSQTIQSLDMFTILACIQVILAHFGGITAALWLLNKINRP